MARVADKEWWYIVECDGRECKYVREVDIKRVNSISGGLRLKDRANKSTIVPSPPNVTM